MSGVIHARLDAEAEHMLHRLNDTSASVRGHTLAGSERRE
jgi:hypothetical protein